MKGVIWQTSDKILPAVLSYSCRLKALMKSIIYYKLAHLRNSLLLHDLIEKKSLEFLGQPPESQ